MLPSVEWNDHIEPIRLAGPMSAMIASVKTGSLMMGQGQKSIYLSDYPRLSRTIQDYPGLSMYPTCLRGKQASVALNTFSPAWRLSSQHQTFLSKSSGTSTWNFPEVVLGHAVRVVLKEFWLSGMSQHPQSHVLQHQSQESSYLDLFGVIKLGARPLARLCFYGLFCEHLHTRMTIHDLRPAVSVSGEPCDMAANIPGLSVRHIEP